MMQALRILSLALVVAAFAGLPGCASHKELKAPCSPETSFLSTQAYAGGLTDRCGPMVRQLGVISSDDPGVTTLGNPRVTNPGDRAVTVF
ncbi:hypothetical protein [Rhizobium jaguaris]|uniref:hypothetical protein n=1 Tax=Rhizobium jaguaris TaxID=1312183 RepID=UPI001968DDE8|nr:hypothetical protein [Rhizobium jaguaris]